MKKKIRKLAIILCFALTIAALGGCGSGDSEKTDKKTTTEKKADKEKELPEEDDDIPEDDDADYISGEAEYQPYEEEERLFVGIWVRDKTQDNWLSIDFDSPWELINYMGDVAESGSLAVHDDGRVCDLLDKDGEIAYTLSVMEDGSLFEEVYQETWSPVDTLPESFAKEAGDTAGGQDTLSGIWMRNKTQDTWLVFPGDGTWGMVNYLGEIAQAGPMVLRDDGVTWDLLDADGTTAYSVSLMNDGGLFDEFYQEDYTKVDALPDTFPTE